MLGKSQSEKTSTVAKFAYQTKKTKKATKNVKKICFSYFIFFSHRLNDILTFAKWFAIFFSGCSMKMKNTRTCTRTHSLGKHICLPQTDCCFSTLEITAIQQLTSENIRCHQKIVYTLTRQLHRIRSARTYQDIGQTKMWTVTFKQSLLTVHKSTKSCLI